jgi:hypothetical protein
LVPSSRACAPPNWYGASLAPFEYEITERGRAFLEIIGPEGETPDIVGRWRSVAGVILRTAVDQMDD